MKPKHIVATTGQFAGQVGSVITSHTYQEIGIYYSVRFAIGSIWIAAAEVRPATEKEIATAMRSTLRPAA